MDLESTACLFCALSQRSSVFIKLLLIGCAHITEPFAIGLNFAGIGVSWNFLQLLHVWLRPVHIEPVDGRSCSELRSWLVTRWVRTIRV